MKRLFLAALILPLVLFISGCLTVEYKKYKFEFTGENSGILTIKYINILSVMDDTLDVSDQDFYELVTTYLEGDQIEQEFPEALIKSKRIFEENGQLCGEVVIEFNDLEQARLFRLNDQGPYMYCLVCSSTTETYDQSNGTFGGDVMPVVFWREDLKVLELMSLVSVPDETTVSLLDDFKEWEKNNK